MRLQKLWKCLAAASLAALTVAICAEPSSGQFPSGGDRGSRGDRGGFQPGGGGPPGGSRGGFTADSSFDRLVQSYGGTGDAVDYSRIPPETRERTNGFAMRFGGEPMPVSGIITRAQYSEQFNARMETMRAKMGQPGGGAPGAPPVVSFTAPAAPPAPPGMPVAPQAEMTDEQLQMAMRQLDRDGDSRISLQEASQSSRMSRAFQTYDKNADGFIDLAEFRGYMIDRMGNRVPSGDNNGQPQPYGQQPYGQQPYGQPNASYGTAPPATEEQRPVVLRYGKMPKELPSWFNDLDTDKDGQVGMYEWRFDSRVVSEFMAMDLNSDGLLTAEEYLRFKNPVSNNATSSESRTISTSSSNPFNRNNTGPSRSASTSEESSDKKDKKDRKDENREKKGKDRGTESGSNPFRR